MFLSQRDEKPVRPLHPVSEKKSLIFRAFSEVHAKETFGTTYKHILQYQNFTVLQDLPGAHPGPDLAGQKNPESYNMPKLRVMS